MVLAEDESICMARELSNHTKTNMWLLKQFFDEEFEIKKQQELVSSVIKEFHQYKFFEVPFLPQGIDGIERLHKLSEMIYPNSELIVN